MNSVKYRPDIDGLRAIAVMLVVAFHASHGLAFKGGFIGVDIFFVISGYLISGIIFHDLSRSSFSLAHFYARRVRRIAPALLIVLIATYVIGSATLFNDEMRQLGKHIAAGAGFVSNIVLWREAGYFDAAATTKPLLHLWSLGIEEQFYLIWPITLILAWKSRSLLIFMLLVFGISLSLATIGVLRDPTAAFFLPHPRFWELTAGALLAWFTMKDRPNSLVNSFRNPLSVGGAILLLFGVVHFNGQTLFPGPWALVPVIGTVGLIAAGPEAWLNRLVLSNRVMVGIGLISFPLYLWHWPLLTILNISEFEWPSRAERAAAVILSLLLAWLTYIFVERKVRFGAHGREKVVVLCVVAALFVGAGLLTYKGVGLFPRNDQKEAFLSQFENAYPTWRYARANDVGAKWRSDCGFWDRQRYLTYGTLPGGTANSKPVAKLSPSCYIRDSRFEKAVMIWGDSHAQVLNAGIAHVLPSNWQLLQVASAGCATDPYIAAPSTDSQCDQTNYFAMKTVEQAKPDVVVVAQATGHSATRMQLISAKLRSLGAKRVLFVGPDPVWWGESLPKVIARRLWNTKPQRTFVGLNMERLQSGEKLTKQFKNSEFSEFVNIIPVFCNAEGCLTRLGTDPAKTITTWDREHLTSQASDFLAVKLLGDKIFHHVPGTP